LKFRKFLPHIGKNAFEMRLKFGSQTLFEFFTIHNISPPFVENTAFLGMTMAGGFCVDFCYLKDEMTLAINAIS